jgi:hypothetical protein
VSADGPFADGVQQSMLARVTSGARTDVNSRGMKSAAVTAATVPYAGRCAGWTGKQSGRDHITNEFGVGEMWHGSRPASKIYGAV